MFHLIKTDDVHFPLYQLPDLFLLFKDTSRPLENTCEKSLKAMQPPNTLVEHPRYSGAHPKAPARF